MVPYTFDTLLVASSEENFQTLFLSERRWHGARVDRRRAGCLKWLAVYRRAPTSAITHYAEILSSHEDPMTGRRSFELNEPIALARAVGSGRSRSVPIQGQRYVFLENLFKAGEIIDLLETK
jgi:hypothetical protein